TVDEKKIWEELKNNKYFKLKPLNTEYNLSCKVGKYWVGGRLDAFMAEEQNEEGKHSGKFVILDYKTGQIPQNPQEDFQTIVYLLCADRYLTKKDGYNSLKFVYLGLKNNQEAEIELSEKLKNKYEEKTVSICKNIDFALNSTVFLKNEKCSNCEYYNICK
ncbi:MAG: PD-(D/E)XK nuclease family protein, partial [Candidatus Gastranaerophilales bacterium]|nr:PD-(D/E)XK nuclease family protein [Candidatus Gastranaerophilales bacterium]